MESLTFEARGHVATICNMTPLQKEIVATIRGNGAPMCGLDLNYKLNAGRSRWSRVTIVGMYWALSELIAMGVLESDERLLRGSHGSRVVAFYKLAARTMA